MCGLDICGVSLPCRIMGSATRDKAIPLNITTLKDVALQGAHKRPAASLLPELACLCYS